MSENEIGNRGSKSEYLISGISVKEQRVYGNYCIKNMLLRSTLMGLERGYQIKIPSKQLILPPVPIRPSGRGWCSQPRLAYAEQIIEKKLFSCAGNALNSIRHSSTFNSNLNLNPWFVTGFYDGEGSFIVSVTKNKNSKLG